MQAGEGEIAEGSPAWESVPAGDRDRRKRAAADKALKLRSPNFAVSTTRLTVRNIPASMSDKALKQLALQAVRCVSWSSAMPTLQLFCNGPQHSPFFKCQLNFATVNCLCR